jgi:ribosome-binding factor A
MTRRRANAPSQRQLRVGEELRHALVDILARGHFRDPALDDVHATVTEVRISPDLRNATAFVVPFAGGDGKELVAALNRAAAYFHGQLARDVRLRFTPTIRFETDTAFETAGRIEALLHDPRVARDLAATDDPAVQGGDSKPGNDA